MSSLYPYCSDINLYVDGRIKKKQAQRQERTAKEILKRLSRQPGLILADEVGMGKTFVALAVAVSAALENRGKRPVVVMIPPSLTDKWPRDFEVFREKCLPKEISKGIEWGLARRAVEFLKFLDDPAGRRKSVVFVTHRAMNLKMTDPWVRLAMIRQSLYRRRDTDGLKRALCRSMGELLQMKGRGWESSSWREILDTHPRDWRELFKRIAPNDEELWKDDPVPEAVWKVLPQLDTGSLYEWLHWIPWRRTKLYRRNLRRGWEGISGEISLLWDKCLGRINLRLPLLILDEAHHLKNDKTQLASLFRSDDSKAVADTVSGGRLAGVFERMLFLTATPFQMGHGELCSVLDRFDGISWKGVLAPGGGREAYAEKKASLRSALDSAQEAAVRLDSAWGRLREGDLRIGDLAYEVKNVAEWWAAAWPGQGCTPEAETAVNHYKETMEKMKEAGRLLHPWVIRHLKEARLTNGEPRRRRIIGRAILPGGQKDDERGLAVRDEALLPFMLAARATFYAPNSRPVFAEGLASSYETFLNTRRKNEKGKVSEAIDGDDDPVENIATSDSMKWYLDKLERLIPKEGAGDVERHPKIEATVDRVVKIWEQGEKVVVFCHYIVTGKILRQRISAAIREKISQLACKKLRCGRKQASIRLEKNRKRFYSLKAPIRKACDKEIRHLIAQHKKLRGSADDLFKEDLVKIVRRNIQTPSFLARFFPLGWKNLDAKAMKKALNSKDLSGRTLREVLSDFFRFLAERGEDERERYIDAIQRIQVGTHFGVDRVDRKAYSDDELQDTQPEKLIPNVRLANGGTGPETRERLMLTFNTPFYPEILIASSIMAEGVDLHLNCRYVIHHDLCWNPSTLEQRTGRVDRVGCKAETRGAEKPIHVYLPFIAETQDEKMYRVVMDRERWFNVVMGAEYKADVATTEKLAERIPFPADAAKELTFKLEA